MDGWKWVELLPRSIGWLVPLFAKFASYKKCQQILFFGLGRFHPTTVLSFLLFRVRIIQPLPCSHGTYSPPITVVHPRSYLRSSISPWIPNSQVRFFYIPCYAPNCPRSLDGNYYLSCSYCNWWALTSPYCSKPLIYVANQMTTFKTLWTRL